QTSSLHRLPLMRRLTKTHDRTVLCRSEMWRSEVLNYEESRSMAKAGHINRRRFVAETTGCAGRRACEVFYCL
ncbi:MAG: hypothetical protein ACYTEK_25530, partial [Planctomycetota bacterium]